MYGMVNQGIRAYVEGQFGAPSWRKIAADAGVSETGFERLVAYDDADTYALVAAIADHSDLPQDDVLRIFGAYWVDYAQSTGFEKLLRLAGRTFIERLGNLDDLHDRIVLTMPSLKPPSFELEEMDSVTYKLRYYSHREGLAPMVVGLLHGLAAETGEQISVEQIHHKSRGGDCDIFVILLHPSDP